jgi:hypothetical protein
MSSENFQTLKKQLQEVAKSIQDYQDQIYNLESTILDETAEFQDLEIEALELRKMYEEDMLLSQQEQLQQYQEQQYQEQQQQQHPQQAARVTNFNKPCNYGGKCRNKNTWCKFIHP